MKTIFGKKIGMTRIFSKNGKSLPVTVVEVGPCFITQVKKSDINGYNSVQIGFDKAKYTNKPEAGHLRKSKKENLSFLKEARIEKTKIDDYNVGDEIKVDIFSVGDIVNTSGVSKGKGFQGTVKRHNFHTGPKSHGSDNYRQPGSIGATYPQRTIKGKRMSGHMGNDNVTVKNLEIVDIIKENNLIVLKGAIPGIKGSIIVIKGK